MTSKQTLAAGGIVGLSLSDVTTEEGFRRLREEWTELVEKDERATIFQTWEFQYHVWCSQPESVDLRVVLVRDRSGELVGCAPLGVQPRRVGGITVRVLGFACLKLCDYSDFIVSCDRAADVLAALALWLNENSQKWDLIRFRPIREDSWINDEHLFLSNVDATFHRNLYDVAPYLKFEREWQSYEDALGKKSAKTMRYKVNKLSRRFDGRFQEVGDSASLHQGFEQTVELHQKRMRQKSQPGAFADSNVREGFHVLLESMWPQGYAKIHRIASDNSCIASLLTLEFRGKVYYYQGGFDPSYHQLSPGLVIHALRINQALSDVASEYDFLIGDEPYKSQFANGKRSVYRIEISTGSRKVFLLYAWEALRSQLVQSKLVRALYLSFRG